MVLSVGVLLFVAVATIVDSRAIDPRCQPMRIPWCLGVYDAVYFPNHLQHQSQEDAYYAMHKLWPLIQTECSPQILHYLCRLYAPQCPYVVADRDSTYVTYQGEQYLPPCEDACTKVRYDCHSVMAKHHIEWPAELDCQKLRDKSCFETPQIEIQRTTEKAEMLQPETTPVVEVREEPTTEATVEQTSESPEVHSEEDTSEAPEEASTVTTEEETTSHATIATPEHETEEPTEVPEEVETEEPTEPMTTAEPEPPLSTTESLLEITTVIVEDPTENENVHESSGDNEEASTAAAVEPEAEPTSEGAEVITPAVDPPAGEEVATANDDLSPTPVAEPANDESPRSDRATGNTSGYSYRKAGICVEMMVIYLATLSLIFHRG